MPYPVRYRCPRCGTVVALERSGYLADRSVTPYPLAGWTYADVVGGATAAARDPPADGAVADGADDPPADGAVADGADDPYAADGVRIVCGEGETDGGGCGEPYYLNFVRFEDGREVVPEPEPEPVRLAHPDRPRRPRGPDGPTR